MLRRGVRFIHLSADGRSAGSPDCLKSFREERASDTPAAPLGANPDETEARRVGPHPNADNADPASVFSYRDEVCRRVEGGRLVRLLMKAAWTPLPAIDSRNILT